MGIKEDIEVLLEMVDRHYGQTPECSRVHDWMNSPSCPLVDENELEDEDEGEDDDEI